MRISVTKQRWYSAHFWPMQFSLLAEISRQKWTESGRPSISARSPTTVSFAHSSTARKSGISSILWNWPEVWKEAKRRRQR